MTFHKEGYPTLLLTLLIGAILIIVSKLYAPFWILALVYIIVAFLLIVVLQFFRSPKRELPVENEKMVYSPADGKVVVIEKTYEPEYLKTECWQVSVFMSPLNVHINRNPISGTVEYLKYHPGKYLVAWHPKSSTENERYTTVYSGTKGKVLIRQIAGALARRIVNNLTEKKQVKQSTEMGFIKFGSRVDVFLPITAKIKVELNQVVKSPTTLLAELS